MSEERAQVLVVDDDPSARRALSCFLRLQGYRVRMAVDGMDALRQVQTERPRVMLLDNKMPYMNGLEVLHRLHASGSNVGVIFITAALDEETRQAAEDFGAIACMEKPIALLDLERCLAAYIRSSAALSNCSADGGEAS